MLKIHDDLLQGSAEWLAARCGLITASEMHLVVSRSMKVTSNDKQRAHLYEILAQRISGYTEPSYIGANMIRGHEDEIEARILYEGAYAPVTECGFMTRDDWGFTLGYSPDGLVGDDGLIECKSRIQKYQVETIISGEMPDEYMMQVQTGFLVSGRKWCDFLSYSGGLHMPVIRVYPDLRIQEAIIKGCMIFEACIAEKLTGYREALASGARLIPTERKIEQEMHL